MKISTIVRAAIATCALAFSAHASAAPILQVNSGGILTGAKGVNVLGKLYDVTFVDGSCISLFSGCHAISDFAFSNLTAATAAANALWTQVIIDSSSGSFDSRPNTVAGCADPSFCQTLIPYSISSLSVNTARYTNWVIGNIRDNMVNTAFITKSTNTDTRADTNYAKFQLVAASIPEPSSIALMGLAFAGLAFSRRRKS